MVNMKDDSYYMSLALRQAEKARHRNEVPIGAVLVKDGRVIAADYNRRELLKDATAHAEILVLRRAGKKMGGWRLPGTTMYVTQAPCPMCAGARRARERRFTERPIPKPKPLTLSITLPRINV